MSSGKFLDRGSWQNTEFRKPDMYHRCKKPVNWLMLRFAPGAKWQCECGDTYIWRWEYNMYSWTDINRNHSLLEPKLYKRPSRKARIGGSGQSARVK